MMLKNYSAIALIIVSAWACQQNPSSETATPEPAKTPDTLQYEIKNTTSNLPCPKDAEKNCVEVKIDELHVSGGTSTKAATIIETALIAALNETDNSPTASRKPADIIANLEKEYLQITKDMKDYDLSWEYFHQIQVYLNTNNLFGCSVYNYTFTGGAHPNGFTFYYTFLSDKGIALSLPDLIIESSLPAFKAMAEKQFRETREIAENQSLEEAGYWFENDVFELNNNFKYDEKGLTIHYNQYEIAPYSEGTITLTFTYEQIKNMVKKEYRF